MKRNFKLFLLSFIVLCGCSSGNNVVKKNLPVYLDEETFNNIDIYFFNNNLDIPYIEIKDSFDNYLCTTNFTCVQDGNNYIATNKITQATMNINYISGEVNIPDINKFRAIYSKNDGVYIDEFFNPSSAPNIPLIKQEKVTDKCRYDSTVAYKVNLKDYGLAPINYNNKGYLPIDVMPLLTSNSLGTYYLSDNKIYNINEDKLKLLEDITVKSSYSKAYFEYSFNMLSLSVELYYGLKGYSKVMVHDGKTFNYLPNGVIQTFATYKNKIINSASLEDFDAAINELVCNTLLDGGHTYVKNRSFGETKKKTLPYDKEMNFTYDIGDVLVKNRKNSPDADAFKEFVSAYDTNDDGKNDIGYITFADFSIENTKKLTSIQTILRGDGTNKGANDLLNPNASGYDSTKNDIKDVVIDLTVNNGGSVIAEGFLLSWLCGGIATQTLRCAKSQTFSTFSYKFDIDGDDQFTAKDYLPNNVNVYILSSRTTYSAANALVFDSYLYNRDSSPSRKVIIMGEKSAGGACSITGNLFLPTGLTYQMSGCDVSVDPKNTSISSESGVDLTEGYTLSRETLALRTGANGINAFIRTKHPLSK